MAEVMAEVAEVTAQMAEVMVEVAGTTATAAEMPAGSPLPQRCSTRPDASTVPASASDRLLACRRSKRRSCRSSTYHRQGRWLRQGTGSLCPTRQQDSCLSQRCSSVYTAPARVMARTSEAVTEAATGAAAAATEAALRHSARGSRQACRPPGATIFTPTQRRSELEETRAQDSALAFLNNKRLTAQPQPDPRGTPESCLRLPHAAVHLRSGGEKALDQPKLVHVCLRACVYVRASRLNFKPVRHGQALRLRAGVS